MRIHYWTLPVTLALILLLAGPAWIYTFGDLELDDHWSEADRSVAGLAPAQAALA